MTTEASVRVIASVDADAGADADASAKGTKTIPHDASTRDVDADEKVSDEESDEAKAIEHASEGAEDGRRRARSSVSDDSRERTVFIGGTSHESDEDAVRAHFEKNFGPVESVKLIYDRQTMARKGYGFVKFFDVDVARKVKTLEKLVIDGKAVDVKEATRDEPVGGHRARASRLSSGGSRDSLSDLVARISIGEGGRQPRKSGAAVPVARPGSKVTAKGATLASSPNYVGSMDDQAEYESEGSGASASSCAPGTESTVFCGGLPIEATPEALGWFFSHYGVVLSVKLIYDRRTGVSKGYGFIVFADVAVAEMVKAQRQMPFMGKMIDVSEAMRHVGRPDDARHLPNGLGGYGSKRYGSQGPFYPPYAMYPHMAMGMPPHVMGAMHPMMHQVPYPGYPSMYGAVSYVVPPPATEEEADDTVSADEPATVAATDETE